MVEIFRVFVLMTCSSSVNSSKTAICAGGVFASELSFGEQDPLPAVRSRIPTRLRASCYDLRPGYAWIRGLGRRIVIGMTSPNL